MADPENHGRLQALDGLRGLAISMVLMAHYTTILADEGWEGRLRGWGSFGNSGVDLFFVLSGFLITRILVRTRDGAGYFRNFYWRRALRIFPLYYAFLVFMALPYRWFCQRYFGRDFFGSTNLFSYFAYYDNLTRDRGTSDFWISHMWSLAIEEQFYLIWPLVVFFCPRRFLLPACLSGAMMSATLRQWLAYRGAGFETIHRVTLTRVDTLLLGAAAGVIHLDDRRREWARRRMAWLLAPCLGIGGGLAATGGLGHDRPLVLGLGWTTLAVAYAVVIFWAATGGASHRILHLRVLQALGKYSYGIYVLHMIAWPFLPSFLGGRTPVQRLAIIATATILAVGLAWLSFHLLEAPFLRLKRRFDYRDSPRPAAGPERIAASLGADGGGGRS